MALNDEFWIEHQVIENYTLRLLITACVRSTTEGYVFTGVC